MSRTERRRLIDPKDVKKQAESRKSGGGWGTVKLPADVEFFSPSKGKNFFDILPYKVTSKNHPEVKAGQIWYRRRYGVHKGIGVNEESVVCPRATFGKPCPICEEHTKLKKDPDADETVVKGLRTKDRELYYVIPRNPGKKSDDTIHLFDTSVHTFGAMLDDEINASELDGCSFMELHDGKTLRVRYVEEAGPGYSYLSARRIDFMDRREDLDDGLLDQLLDLDKVLVVKEYAELEKMLRGDEDDDSDDEDEEDDDDASTKKTSKKSSKKDDDEDEEDEEEDEEEEESEDDEEDEKPKKKAKKVVEDDEDDDEEDDDEEDDDEDDDEKPVKKGKKVVEEDDEEDDDSDDEDEAEEEADDEDDDSDDEEDEEEDEEDEKPVKKGKKVVEEDDEDDEEDDEEEEEEEDEKPVKKGKKKCPACEGTGKNSKGRPCPICGGTGYKK